MCLRPAHGFATHRLAMPGLSVRPRHAATVRIGRRDRLTMRRDVAFQGHHIDFLHHPTECRGTGTGQAADCQLKYHPEFARVKRQPVRHAATIYLSPITIAATATLKAVAIDAAGNASAVTTEAYAIETPPASAEAFVSASTWTVAERRHCGRQRRAAGV